MQIKNVLFSALGIVVTLFFALAPTGALASTQNWSATQDLSASTNNAVNPQIAVDGSGHQIAVWSFGTYPSITVQASSSSDYGQTWSAPTDLSSAGYGSTWFTRVFSPRVQMNSSGDAVAVWDFWTGAQYTTQAAFSSDFGAHWTTPVNVAAQWGTSPEASIGPTGIVTVVYTYFDGTDDSLYSTSTSDQGQNWSTPTPIALAAGAFTNFKMQMDSTGNLFAYWRQQDGSSIPRIMFASSTTQGVTWSSPLAISPSGQEAGTSDLYIQPDGKLAAVWNVGSAGNFTIQYSQSTDSGANWSTPMNLTPADEVGNPKIAGSGSDALIVTWGGWVGSGYSLYSRTSTDFGSTWSNAVLVAPGDTNTYDVNYVSSSIAVASWLGSDGANNLVYVSQTSDNGLSWTNGVPLSAAGQSADSPYFASDLQGNLAAVWHRSDGTYTRIQTTTMHTRYAVSYNSNEGTGQIQEQYFDTGSSPLTIAGGQTLQRTGFEFAGWNTRADGSGTAYATGQTFTPQSDQTFYAQWTAAELAATGVSMNSAAAALAAVAFGIVLIVRRKLRSSEFTQ